MNDQQPGPPPEDGVETDPARDDAPTDGRARLWAALRRPGSRGQAIVAVLLAVLGFAAVTQVRSNGRDDNYIGARQGDLIQLINNLSLASQRAENEITKLQRTRTSLGNDTEARRTALTRARQQADTLGLLAGTLPAEGPGVRITVTDPASGSGVGTNQLINGLEELRDAGAEVIEINDSVRVIAQTSLVDSPGGGVLADGERLKAPYTIDAIGDSRTLATALDFTGGFIDEVDGVGGKVHVQQLPQVRVTSIRRPVQPQYAKPGSTG